jgi:hypothetical protein
MLISRKDLFTVSNQGNIISTPYNESSEYESFFSISLDCLRESNDEIRKMISNIYTESKYGLVDEAVFQEGFTDKFNFKDLIKAIVKMFVNVIINLFNRFRALIIRIFSSDTAIKKYQTDLSTYDKSLKVDFDHYNYTYYDANIPPANLDMQFKDEYDKLQEKLEKIGKTRSKDDLINQLDQYAQEIEKEKLETFYDEVRRKVFPSGSKYGDKYVFKDQYIDMLNNSLRDGGKLLSQKEPIPSNEVHNALERFNGYKETIKKIKQQQLDLKQSADNIEKSIKKIKGADFLIDYTPIDTEIEFHIDKILKSKCGEISEMCNIYVLAFSTELDAVKEALVQDKKVLFAAISDIIVNGGR